ncbi:hypothetical protein FAF44_02385 [Nonomuraea sp. MG754425]|uniref:hypothetical protein n=1 Tax=Nonomuraea sp. MG754425 TaxID=2570319 RepID=UPI001F15B6F8|nr:hypothetical protein [Nonomuraea sp. MG754425]MCF6467260.1 hypothetical protein [Nonomuraea sp. MG754425]
MRKTVLALAAAGLWTLLSASAHAVSLPATVPAPPPAGLAPPALTAPAPAAEPAAPAPAPEPAPPSSLVTVFNDEIIEPINIPVSTCENVLSQHSSTSCNAGAASATTVP